MYDSYDEIEAGYGGEWIAKNLCPNDNIVVPITKDEPFWLMFIDKVAHVDGNEWIEGDIVIRSF
jgi:hypothetical protein